MSAGNLKIIQFWPDQFSKVSWSVVCPLMSSNMQWFLVSPHLHPSCKCSLLLCFLQISESELAWRNCSTSGWGLDATSRLSIYCSIGTRHRTSEIFVCQSPEVPENMRYNQSIRLLGLLYHPGVNHGCWLNFRKTSLTASYTRTLLNWEKGWQVPQRSIYDQPKGGGADPDSELI